MAKIVDARGLACPQPVILTRKAMQEADHIVTLVDNENSAANVSRVAEKAGWQVRVTPQGNEFQIELTREPQTSLALGPSGEEAKGSGGPLVLVVAADTMGRGDAELGSLLIRGFFHALGEVEPLPQTVILFNTGVKLACEGSAVLEDLCALEAQGVQLLACGTCLNYFGLTEKLAVGQVSNMYTIAETLLNAGKVIHL